jgi:phosphatidylglycerol:prolipoprotein diacylglycerol transferase
LPDRVAFYIGSIPVHWYGIMIMLGVIAASYLAYREAKRRREDPDHVWQLFPWVLISGILGARIGWVIASLGDPRMGDPANWFKIWEGGLSIHGAIIGAAIAIAIYCRRYDISFFKWADIIAPGLALGQAVGRWGNFFNQEAFGGPTTLPWGIQIAPERQEAVIGNGWRGDPNLRFHPTFAYEMIWDLLNVVLLLWLGRQKRFKLREGDILWVYLIFYSVGRYFIEGIRVDSAKFIDFKTPQIISIILALLGIVMLILRHRPDSTAPLADERVGGPASRVASTAATPSKRMATAMSGASGGSGSTRLSREPRGRASRVRKVPAKEQADASRADSMTEDSPTVE